MEVSVFPDDIDFSNLPQQFVIKANNGSRDFIIVENKDNINVDEVKIHFKTLFKHPYGIKSAEPHYFRIKPRIIVEKLLDKNDQEVKFSSLIDYKFWCFNDKPDRCFVCSNRTKEHFTIDLYKADLNWEHIADGNLQYGPEHIKSDILLPRPKSLADMLKMASEFSKGVPQMRVDFYEVGGKAYFGEMTLTAASGRSTSHTEKGLTEMGRLCENEIMNIGKYMIADGIG